MVQICALPSDDFHYWLQGFRGPDTFAYLLVVLVPTEVLVALDRHNMAVAHDVRQCIWEGSVFEYDWPPTPHHVVKERYSVCAPNYTLVAALLVYDWVVENFVSVAP